MKKLTVLGSVLRPLLCAKSAYRSSGFTPHSERLREYFVSGMLYKNITLSQKSSGLLHFFKTQFFLIYLYKVCT